ncbi:MAG: fatty acyl-AMP ligase, partial [Candidatus Obscuribacterales bacterium]|nr:fatty acyl-AMP ligase [Steroidobacteraceae bacterium]
GKTAFTFLDDGEEVGESISYLELRERVLMLAALLQRRFAPRERVLLLYPACIDYMVAFLACLCADLVAVPLFPPRSTKHSARLEAIARDCTPCAALLSSKRMGPARAALTVSPHLAALEQLCTDDISKTDVSIWSYPNVKNGTIAFLQYTSGSTGLPKGVMVSHGNLLHNEQQMQMCFESDAQSRFVTWLPIYHDMGLIGNMLAPLWLGSECVFMAPVAFLQRPIRWLRAISRYRPHVSGAPNFAYDLCVDKIPAAQREGLDLSSWTVAFNGAEPIRHATLERFVDAFAPYGFKAKSFYPCYGMAEATLIVSGGAASQPPNYKWVDKARLAQQSIVEDDKTRGQALVGCGSARLGQTIRIVDVATHTPCPEGAVGEIWLSGPSVAEGYWDRPELNEEVFNAHIVGSNAGPYLRTGDLGFLDGDELYITGRIKDLIIVRGANHYPQDIEATIESVDTSINPAGVAAFGVEDEAGERVVVVAEIARTSLRKIDSKSLAMRMRQQVFEQREVVIDDIVLIRPGTLPKSSSGKVQRGRCRTLYLANDLATIAAATAASEPIYE